MYLCSASPPVRFPNVYGVDMPTRREFVATNLDVEQIREARVVTVHGMPLAWLHTLAARPPESCLQWQRQLAASVFGIMCCLLAHHGRQHRRLWCC